MKYISVRNLEKYHPGYKDRKLQWMKLYFDMVQGDPEFEMIESEIDKWRFVCLAVLELEAQKPLPLDDGYFKRKGFDIKKRPMSMTLRMLHNFIDIVTVDEKVCSVDKDKEEEKEKSKKFAPPTLDEVKTFFIESGYTEESALKAYQYYSTADWHDSTGKKIKNWKQKFIAVWFKDENRAQIDDHDYYYAQCPDVPAHRVICEKGQFVTCKRCEGRPVMQVYKMTEAQKKIAQKKTP